MKTIIQFLKDQIVPFSESNEKVNATDEEIENIKNLFFYHLKSVTQAKHLKIQPRIQRNQIWTVKNEYHDFQGLSQKTTHPILVLINTDPDDIEDENFTRVFLVSPFVEMASSNDEVCKDSSLIGFSFLIETWNDQPILTELLDEYLGYYEAKSICISKYSSFELVNEPSFDYSKSNAEGLTKVELEFRNIEISRAKYINHSVLSLLSFLENRQSVDAGVVISLCDQIEYPKFYIGQNQKQSNFALAARSGVDTEDKYLLYENENLPFQIIIRRNEEGFIISVHTTDKVILKTNKNEEIRCNYNKDRSVFANIKAGYYTLISEKLEQHIKIRLK